MTHHIVVKALLIAIFVFFALVVLLPTGGARRSAIRKLSLLALLGLAVLAVANAVGVGRGTDLLLYGLIVVFMGSSVSTAARSRLAERQITEIGRRIALLEADKPHRHPPFDETI
jgi:hypothetical protein